MKFFDRLGEILTRALGLTSLSPWTDEPSSQRPLALADVGELYPIVDTPPMTQAVPAVSTSTIDEPSVAVGTQPTHIAKVVNIKNNDDNVPNGPVFAPPNSSPGFVCDYSAMKGWRHAGSSGSRTSWLEKPISENDPTGGVFNIFTNYEAYHPIGITRRVRRIARSKFCHRIESFIS